jgi:hypothetical protein
VAVPRGQPVVLALLRDAHPGVTIHSELSPTALDHLPYVHCRFGELQLRHPRLKLAVPVTVYSMVRGDAKAADELAGALYLTLRDAVERQVVTDAGHITDLQVRAWPADSPIPGQPSGVLRREAVYLLGIRPASVTP